MTLVFNTFDLGLIKWGNQADVTTNPKEKSERHKFIWSKAKWRWFLRVDKNWKREINGTTGQNLNACLWTVTILHCYQLWKPQGRKTAQSHCKPRIRQPARVCAKQPLFPLATPSDLFGLFQIFLQEQVLKPSPDNLSTSLCLIIVVNTGSGHSESFLGIGSWTQGEKHYLSWHGQATAASYVWMRQLYWAFARCQALLHRCKHRQSDSRVITHSSVLSSCIKQPERKAEVNNDGQWQRAR